MLYECKWCVLPLPLSLPFVNIQTAESSWHWSTTSKKIIMIFHSVRHFFRLKWFSLNFISLMLILIPIPILILCSLCIYTFLAILVSWNACIGRPVFPTLCHQRWMFSVQCAVFALALSVGRAWSACFFLSIAVGSLFVSIFWVELSWWGFRFVEIPGRICSKEKPFSC